MNLMNWVWFAWWGLAVLLLVCAVRMEISSIRRREGGANGLVWLVAHVFVGLVSLGIAGLTWWWSGWSAALLSLAATACVFLASIFTGIRVFRREIAKAMEGGH